MENFFVNIAIPLSIGLVVIAAALIVVFTLLGLVSDLKGATKGLITVGVLAVLAFILYSIAPSVAPSGLTPDMLSDLTPNKIKYIGSSIRLSIILMIVGFVSAVAFELYNLVK